jgi:hypothetical protein
MVNAGSLDLLRDWQRLARIIVASVPLGTLGRDQFHADCVCGRGHAWRRDQRIVPPAIKL